MQYRRLGRAGLKVSELSYGAWLTFGGQMDLEEARSCMRQAFEAGVNFFDNAEAYGRGEAERVMGRIVKDYKRSDLVLSTKLFWGGAGPNDEGLSWKHLMEGIDASLKRLELEYVDLLFCHRPDPHTPIDETVRAMDLIVRSGRAFYWGTSEWPAEAIEEAHRLARELGCIPPVMEQPEYNLLCRDRVEVEYAPLYEKHGMGTTTFSPLASGILSGKYQNGIPAGSRLEREGWLRDRLTEQNLGRVRALEGVARELGCSLAQLSIAWCLANPRVSTVILGASGPEQLAENLGALEARERLGAETLAAVEDALGAPSAR